MANWLQAFRQLFVVDIKPAFQIFDNPFRENLRRDIGEELQTLGKRLESKNEAIRDELERIRAHIESNTHLSPEDVLSVAENLNRRIPSRSCCRDLREQYRRDLQVRTARLLEAQEQILRERGIAQRLRDEIIELRAQLRSVRVRDQTHY